MLRKLLILSSLVLGANVSLATDNYKLLKKLDHVIVGKWIIINELNPDEEIKGTVQIKRTEFDLTYKVISDVPFLQAYIKFR